MRELTLRWLFFPQSFTAPVYFNYYFRFDHGNLHFFHLLFQAKLILFPIELASDLLYHVGIHDGKES